MPRVLIDATALPANRGGVGRYVDELVSRLPELGIDLHVASQPRDTSVYAALLPSERVHSTPTLATSRVARLGWEQTGLPLLVRRLAPDIVHSPHYTLPLLTSLGRRPSIVVTVHDATFFSHPELHLGTKARFFRAWTRIATRRADALIVPSEATRDEVVSHTGVDATRIAVVPHGVDHARFRPPDEPERVEVRQWLGLDPEQPYVAFLGTLEPRKNIPALVQAFVSATDGLDRPPVLVLAGGKGWDDQVEGAVSRVPSHLTVLRPGFLPDGLVPAYLGGAEVVAYPAFGEGFGLPVLEAMACGAAVLTTRLLSLPEVGGEAVAYAETPGAADIAIALRSLLDDPRRRRELSGAALRRAQGYTWGAAARGHLEVYEAVSP